ncbi:hypothetical protein EVAR_15929_1 [Eumeta japonica]|uniref:Uncharacterized protein n=1 Tax=Eumeta variegata TaxID=151549 RepID=A0A4C1UME4_EUMVA|nr:hypothetical protein EVAR_15929_1 [Eumeta japonica]
MDECDSDALVLTTKMEMIRFSGSRAAVRLKKIINNGTSTAGRGRIPRHHSVYGAVLKGRVLTDALTRTPEQTNRKPVLAVVVLLINTSKLRATDQTPHRPRDRLATAFFARHFGARMRPPTAASVSRLTKQNAGGDI